MKPKRTPLLMMIALGWAVGMSAARAENNNDPSFDINSTSIGTRMKNAFEPTRTTANFDTTTNGSVGTRMLNATSDHERMTNKAGSQAAHERSIQQTQVYSYSTSADTARAATLENNADSNLTAQDQSNSPQDLELTRRIRRDLMSRDLSMSAKNVKIITINGLVTLKGEVASSTERQTIEDIAGSAAGRGNVRDEIMISK